ncbi:MAG: ABC transporter permease [Anaerolineae bacterium]|nr:ABC transporter permease [Anaerolineae bacterium]
MIDSLHRIWSLVVKELLQLSRDKLLLGFVILGPLFELALMGGMVGGGINNLPTAVIDMDRTSSSRALTARLERTDELLVRHYDGGVDGARAQMQRGELAAIVVIPPGYGAALVDAGRGAVVQVIVDDSNYVVAAVATSTSMDVASDVVRDLTAHYGYVNRAGIDMRFIARFNADLDDRPRSITAMLGLIIFQVTLVIAAQSFTRERELGTLEQLRITPLGRVELIVGKAVPTLLIGLVDGLLMIGVVALWFEVPMRGSLPLLMLLTVPFILSQIGWGTLISLVSHTQQQSVLFVFALAMLEVACSGFIVPASDMPAVMRFVSNASSVQHYLVILRGVMLRGAALGVLWRPVLSLAAIGLGSMGVAWLRLRAGLDTDSVGQWLRAAFRLAAERRQQRRAARAGSRVENKRKQSPEWTGEPA